MSQEFDPQKLAGLLLTDQAALDQAMATGNITRVSAASLARLTDWNGLTQQQEREKENQRLSDRHLQEALADAEYEQTMEDVRQQADLLTAQLDDQRREYLQKLADADSRAIVLPDGRHILVGDTPGEFIDENTGKTLEGADKDEAQKLQKADSETAAERKQLTDYLQNIDDAEEHVRKAETIANQDEKNLSPEQKKQNEIEAQKELSLAKATANAETEFSKPDQTSSLTNTDALSALGLDDSSSTRSTSFASTMDKKNTSAINLQDQFTGAGQQATASPQPSLPSTATKTYAPNATNT